MSERVWESMGGPTPSYFLAAIGVCVYIHTYVGGLLCCRFYKVFFKIRISLRRQSVLVSAV